jgi:hypothetical protein
MNNEKKLFWIFLIISIIAVIINGSFGIFNEVYKIPNYLTSIGIISNFTDSVLALYFGTLILSIPSSFYKCIYVGILGFILVVLIDFIGLSVIFFSVGAILLVLLFILIMRIFKIGILKTIGLMVIQTAIMILINVSVGLVYYLLLQFT